MLIGLAMVLVAMALTFGVATSLETGARQPDDTYTPPTPRNPFER